jgi:uncharacterized Zn finger protein
MRVSVRNIVAKCRNCGADDFEAIGESHYTMLAAMACTRCGSPTTRGALLVQIGDEAVRLSRESLEQLRKQQRERRNR